MKFKYNGDKKDMKGVFGLDFSKGKVVEVTDSHAIEKLSNNSHFDVVKKRKPNKKVI